MFLMCLALGNDFFVCSFEHLWLNWYLLKQVNYMWSQTFIDRDYLSLESVVQNVEMYYVEQSWGKVGILSKG